jgi:hypothetical protein
LRRSVSAVLDEENTEAACAKGTPELKARLHCLAVVVKVDDGASTGRTSQLEGVDRGSIRRAKRVRNDVVRGTARSDLVSREEPPARKGAHGGHEKQGDTKEGREKRTESKHANP